MLFFVGVEKDFLLFVKKLLVFMCEEFEEYMIDFVEVFIVVVGIVVKKDVFFMVVCFKNGFVDFVVLFVKFIREDFLLIC